MPFIKDKKEQEEKNGNGKRKVSIVKYLFRNKIHKSLCNKKMYIQE